MSDVRLADQTTFHLGGPVRRFVEATSRDELFRTVADLDAAGEDVLLLGGGSNMIVADAGFDGTVVKVATTGIHAEDTGCIGGIEVTAEAGEVWDDLVARAVRDEWIGVEALSGIPGSVGAVPIQNVGAYGQDVSETLTQVHTFDRLDRRTRMFPWADCRFGYRDSVFKQTPGRYVVGAVTFQFRPGSLGCPIKYAELARQLGVEVGDRVQCARVRETVLAIRAGKGMVIDEADHDTWSAGSFFTNPFVAEDQVPDGAPAFPQPDGRVKTSAAWLIDHAGFGKGYGNDRVSLSTKHVLALTNRGGGTTSDLMALAAEIRDGVEAAYGIRLHAEPNLVGCAF